MKITCCVAVIVKVNLYHEAGMQTHMGEKCDDETPLCYTYTVSVLRGLHREMRSRKAVTISLHFGS